MDGNTRAAEGFSWVPPRSTVMLVSPKPKRRPDSKSNAGSGSYTTPPVFCGRPDNDIQKKLLKKSLNVLRLSPARDRSQSEITGKQEPRKERPRSSTFQNDTILSARSPKSERRNQPEPTDEKRKHDGNEYDKSVFASKKVGNDALNVELESVLASRKISEFNPSQKFVSMSYERDCKEDGQLCSIEEGAMYAKRVGSSENGSDGEKSDTGPKRKVNDKKNSPLTEKRRPKKGTGKTAEDESKKSQISENEITPESTSTHESTNPAFSLYNQEYLENLDEDEKPKKKSVFEMKDLRDEAVDIDDLLSRKISKESQNERFVSMSYETQRVRKTNYANPSPRNMQGGMYARKIAKKGGESEKEKSSLGPSNRGDNGPELTVRERKTSKFVNSPMNRNDSFKVDELLSRRRKESEESNSEKFISICWQREEPSSGGQEGGIYAKRVRSKTTT